VRRAAAASTTQLVHRVDERIGLRRLDDHFVGVIGRSGGRSSASVWTSVSLNDW
jgi:hypothetical protein